MTGASVDTLLVFVHVPAGAIAALAGAGAMFAPKGGPSHRWCGRTYLRSLIVVTGTGLALVATRGPHFAHLGALGFAAASLGVLGYSARRRPTSSAHIACMAASYIVMLTAFYVDNGRSFRDGESCPRSHLVSAHVARRDVLASAPHLGFGAPGRNRTSDLGIRSPPL